MSPLLRSFEDAFHRYLRGSGRPTDPSLAAFIMDDDAATDPNYRARRFVKVLSGINLLPPTTLRIFKINLVQSIPNSATFGGQYNVRCFFLRTTTADLACDPGPTDSPGCHSTTAAYLSLQAGCLY